MSMFRSLHMKLTLILLLLISSLMAVVGAFLTTSVSSFYIDTFYQQMSEVFSVSNRDFVDSLRREAAQDDGASRINDMLEIRAGSLGIDYRTMVEKNHVEEGYMLEILKGLGEGREGAVVPVGSCGLDEAIQQGCDMIDWGKKEVSDDPDWKIGKGFAMIMQGSGLPGLDHAEAIAKLETDGTVILNSGGADLGTGLDTISAKIVAEVLKLRVSVGGSVLYDGLMDETPAAVDTLLPAGSDTLDYQLTAYLDTSVGNPYMYQQLVADFYWWVADSEELAPPTGDTMQPLLWGAAVLVSGAALTVLLRRRREVSHD